MKRRTAIQYFSALTGYSLTPSLVSGLMASCKGEGNGLENKLHFSEPEDMLILEKLGEAFLPKTGTPGSIDVQAHLFVDVFLAKLANGKDQDIFTKGFVVWKEAFEKVTGTAIENAEQEAYTVNLNTYLDTGEEQKNKVNELLAGEEPANKELRDTYLIHSFLKKFKPLVMMGYFVSETIGENVMSYLPVPGDYEGCIPVSDVGNSWSLG